MQYLAQNRILSGNNFFKIAPILASSSKHFQKSLRGSLPSKHRQGHCEAYSLLGPSLQREQISCNMINSTGDMK